MDAHTGWASVFELRILRNIISRKEQDMAQPRLCRRLLAILVSAMLTSAARAEVVFGGIGAGDMIGTEAVLWVRADDRGGIANLTADVATDADFPNIVAMLSGATSRDSDFTAKLLVGALAPIRRYFCRFRISDGIASPTGQFATAPAPQQRASVRFGFSGDADGQFRPYPSIANLAAQKLDFLSFSTTQCTRSQAPARLPFPLITGETTDPMQRTAALLAYNRKYLENMLGVNSATDDHMARVTQLQYLADPNTPTARPWFPALFSCWRVRSAGVAPTALPITASRQFRRRPTHATQARSRRESRASACRGTCPDCATSSAKATRTRVPILAGRLSFAGYLQLHDCRCGRGQHSDSDDLGHPFLPAEHFPAGCNRGEPDLQLSDRAALAAHGAQRAMAVSRLVAARYGRVIFNANSHRSPIPAASCEPADDATDQISGV